MSAGSVIVGLLSSLVGGRIYANTFPQENENPTWPAIRFAVVSETPFPDQCGSDDTGSDDSRVQIDIVAVTYDEMLGLKAAAIAAMATSVPGAFRESGGFETFDSETKTHRTVLDYTLQPSTV